MQNLSTQQRAGLSRALQTGLDQAARTLGTMLGGEVEIRLTSAGLRSPGVCVWLGMTGALPGGLYLDLPEQMALDIVKTLTAGSDLGLLDEAARSALMELINVLGSVFVGHFDQKFGLRSLPTPPEISLAQLEIPPFCHLFCASLSWSGSQESGELLIGLEQPAVDILLA